MDKCCSYLLKFLNFKNCIKNYIQIDEESDSINPKENKIIIIQKSSGNDFNLQGDLTKLENYDLFKKFLKIPLFTKLWKLKYILKKYFDPIKK